MTEENTLIFSTRVQVIYFTTEDETLEKEFATANKRISFVEGKEILKSRNISFKEIFKIKYELHDLKIDVKDYKNQIVGD